MKIYTVKIDGEYCPINIKLHKSAFDIEYDISYVGSKKDVIVEPIEISHTDINGEEVDKESKDNKFANIGKGPAGIFFDEFAYDKLSDLFDGTCEFYKCVANTGTKYYYLNIVSTISDAIDYDKSDIKWLNEDEKRAMRFKKYYFNAEKIGTKSIFRIEEDRNVVYVTNEFVEICTLNKIKGLKFTLVWDSEDDSIKYPYENIEEIL